MTFAQAQMDARNEGIDIGLREAAVSLYKNGMTKSTIAQMLGYPLATIERWIKQEETEHADL